MGKYAPVDGCVNCAAIKEMCVGCAMDWKLTHFDDELKMLRRIVRGCSVTGLLKKEPELLKMYKEWGKHRKKKPPLKEDADVRKTMQQLPEAARRARAATRPARKRTRSR